MEQSIEKLITRHGLYILGIQKRALQRTGHINEDDYEISIAFESRVWILGFDVPMQDDFIDGEKVGRRRSQIEQKGLQRLIESLCFCFAKRQDLVGMPFEDLMAVN